MLVGVNAKQTRATFPKSKQLLPPMVPKINLSHNAFEKRSPGLNALKPEPTSVYTALVPSECSNQMLIPGVNGAAQLYIHYMPDDISVILTSLETLSSCGWFVFSEAL